ncbi:MAG TPA: chemotaxis protein CheB [Blastocatellia bacterium]|jgi:two-component system chemotaxis response regulator CheB|nr:chemotaxis protein CheB [Blastocatellia bacterium]
MNKNIIVVGASYGGVEAMKTLVGGLPEKFPGTVLLVQHLSPTSPSLLPEILAAAGPLPVSFLKDIQPLKAGHIYVAPPDHHLLLEQGHVRLTRGPKENSFRPSIDALFRSAAYAYGPRVVGVILTGLLDDGTAGLWAVKDRGGTAIVQDPKEAIAPSMPKSAMQNVEVDYRLSLSDIALTLNELAHTPAVKEGTHAVSERMKAEVEIARENRAIDERIQEMFETSSFTCPECHGVLLQLKEGAILRFRCHTGHAYSAVTLLEDGEGGVESSLWGAVRSLEERILLLRHFAEHLESNSRSADAAALLQEIEKTKKKADFVRQAVTLG